MTRRFFVIGPQKSGTTLLARLLDQQPGVACMFESYIWSERRSVLVDGGGNGRLHGFAPVDQNRWRDRLAPAFWPEADHPPETDGAEQVDALRDVLTEVLDDFGRRLGADVVGDKWPFYSDRLPLLLDAFPDAVYVHTVRDPRGLWNSAEQFRGRSRGWRLLGDLLRRDALIHAVCRERGVALEVVRYEELLDDPAAVLARLAHAIGFAPQVPLPAYDPARDPLPRRWNWVPESTGSIDPRHGSKWRTNVPRSTVTEIETAAAFYMQRHGYETATWASVAVGILSLSGEEAETRALVDGISSIGDPDVSVHVLVNGGDTDDLADLAALGRVTVRGVPGNLGVAAGRNHLLGDEAFRAADIVGFLDNDLLVFANIFDAVRAAFATHPDARVIGTALFDHADFVVAFPGVVAESGDDDLRARPIEPAAIRATPRWSVALARCARNLGSNVDLAYAYESPAGHLYSAFLRRGVQIPADRHLYNSGVPDLARRFAGGESLACGNVPGGVSFFGGADVRAGIVRYDERFGPYGAEDVDLSWRLVDAGSRNRVTLAAGAVHATSSRQEERRPAGRMFVEQVNVSRVRGLLIRDRHADDWRTRLLGQAVASMLAEGIHQRAAPERRLLAWMVGATLVERPAPRDGEFGWPFAIEVDILDRDPQRFRRTAREPKSLRAVLDAFEQCRAMPMPDEEHVERQVTELADLALELGRQLDTEFDDALGLLAGHALAGESGSPDVDRAVARAQAAEGQARASARRIDELERELDGRQRRLDRKAVRLTLSAADRLGQLRRRLRRPRRT